MKTRLKIRFELPFSGTEKRIAISEFAIPTLDQKSPHRSRLRKMLDNSSNSRDVSNGERNLDTNIEGHPVDVHVGNQVRLRRISAGFSEEELRAALAVTAEQMHAYESGAMRIGASLLYEVSKLLECLPTVFFEEMKISQPAK